jgi:hypothetical protein
MQPPGDPDMVAGVKGLYAGLLEKVEFTILQLSNWNLLHPELIRNENQRVFDKLNDLAEAMEQSTNLSGCSSTVVDNISHPSRPNRPDLSQGVAFATSPKPLLVNGRKERLTTRVAELMMDQSFTGAMTNKGLAVIPQQHHRCRYRRRHSPLLHHHHHHLLLLLLLLLLRLQQQPLLLLLLLHLLPLFQHHHNQIHT